MHLIHPASLFWLLLALPLVALFLLKVRPRQQAVSTVLFWQQVIPDSRPRRWWQRLRHPLSLIIQLLILAMLVMALAEPSGSHRQQNDVLLVVVDTSASMRATDVLPSRLAIAKRRVREMIEALGPQDQMALVNAGARAKVVHGLTSHQRSLRNALDQVRPTDGPGRLAEAIELARRLHPHSPNCQLIVVTDPGGRRAVESNVVSHDDTQPDSDVERVDDSTAVRWVLCGQAADNVAITQFQVRRQALDPIGFECLIEVTSFAIKRRECRLRLELDGQLQDVIPLVLEPRQSELRVLSYASASGGVVSAKLDVHDALPSDNQAVGWLTPRRPRRIELVTSGNRYLEKVLSAVPLVDLRVVPDASSAPLDDTVTIIHSRPIDRLPPGRCMVVQPAPFEDLWQLGPTLPDAVVGRQRERSALLTHLHLVDLPVAGSRSLKLPPEANVFAETFRGDPIYAIVPHSNGEVLLLNVDLRAGDFAWRTAFPLLMSNAVNWLVGQTANYQASYATGEVVSLDELIDTRKGMSNDRSTSTASDPSSASDPSDAASDSPDAASDSSWQVRSPRGLIQQFEGDAPLPPLGPLDQAGVWTVRRVANGSGRVKGDEPVALHLACNVVNRQESDLQAGVVEPFVTSSMVSMARSGQPPWCYLLAAVLLFLAVEWWLYQRRWVS